MCIKMPERAEGDLQLLMNILGKRITYMLLQTKTTKSARKYVNVYVRKNKGGWLWNALMKVLVPFQPVTSRRTGKRRLSVFAWIYMMLMPAVFSILILFFDILPWMRNVFFVLFWLGIILVSIMPYVKALIYLQVNKQYYKEVVKNGERFYYN